jgi:hypothetical protein
MGCHTAAAVYRVCSAASQYAPQHLRGVSIVAEIIGPLWVPSDTANIAAWVAFWIALIGDGLDGVSAVEGQGCWCLRAVAACSNDDY